MKNNKKIILYSSYSFAISSRNWEISEVNILHTFKSNNKISNYVIGKGLFIWTFFLLVTFEAVHLFHCFLKKCSNTFIQSLYRDGKLITEDPGMQTKSCFIQNIYLLYTHIFVEIILSWQKCVHIDPHFLQNITELQGREKAGTHCTCFISTPYLYYLNVMRVMTHMLKQRVSYCTVHSFLRKEVNRTAREWG